RIVRIENGCAGYVHNAGTVSGVILAVEGGDEESARDICMHIAAMRPTVAKADDLPQELVATERQSLRDAALAEGKPENIVDQMVEGRMRNFLESQGVLSEQTYVKDDSQSVGKFAAGKEMKLLQFVRWELGDDADESSSTESEDAGE
ncbi:MAG: translation elongation factor Ts, partial [Planctomycetaceae bacterium]|nr:translation elongation factor Ts [Planctomycetaceae bacterium]